MGNAQDSVKVCADVVTASNEEDGVALAVEKAILSEIRPAEIPLDQLNERARHALMGNLGIQYTYASEDRVEATMPVDERTRQPFGILHGGATLALAETVAGLGSMILASPTRLWLVCRSAVTTCHLPTREIPYVPSVPLSTKDVHHMSGMWTYLRRRTSWCLPYG